MENPRPQIVTSHLADDRLKAEVLNLGSYDVLWKPFHKTCHPSGQRGMTAREIDAEARPSGRRNSHLDNPFWTTSSARQFVGLNTTS